MRKVKQDTMAIYTRHTEKLAPSLTDDLPTLLRNTHDEREQQEKTVRSLSITKDNNANDSRGGNHDHTDMSISLLPQLSTEILSSPPDSASSSTSSQSASSMNCSQTVLATSSTALQQTDHPQTQGIKGLKQWHVSFLSRTFPPATFPLFSFSFLSHTHAHTHTLFGLLYYYRHVALTPLIDPYYRPLMLLHNLTTL